MSSFGMSIIPVCNPPISCKASTQVIRNHGPKAPMNRGALTFHPAETPAHFDGYPCPATGLGVVVTKISDKYITELGNI